MLATKWQRISHYGRIRHLSIAIELRSTQSLSDAMVLRRRVILYSDSNSNCTYQTFTPASYHGTMHWMSSNIEESKGLQ